MSIFPKGSSKPTTQNLKSQVSDSVIDTRVDSRVDSIVDSIVQFEDDGAVILAVVTAIKKDKRTILTIRGRELDLAPQRLYTLPGAAASITGSTAARIEALKAQQERIESEADALNVSELWSFVQDDVRTYSVAELCKSYFGSDTLEKHAGLRIALIRERLHFKRDKDLFEPRVAAVVDDLKCAEEAKRKKAQVREITVEFLAKRKQDSTLPIPLEIRDNIQLLEEVAAGIQHTEPARQKEGKELVHLAMQLLKLPENTSPEKQAFEILLTIGHFERDTNLSFIRHRIPVQHEARAVLEGESLVIPSEIADFPEHERSFREDLTRLRAITIDDVSTQDMDDAISLEQTQDGYQLGIHITDVAWAVLPETYLDFAARRRATSIYSADQTVNMLPSELSESKLSLKQGAVRPALSVILSMDRSFEVLSSRITPAFIKAAERYSYDQVDHLLEQGDSTLLLLHDIAAACEERRIRKGATRVHKREVVPFKEEDGSIRLLEIEEDGPARMLVSEMMVLANSIMAQFAATHGIPVLFRGQERAEVAKEGAKDGATEELVPEGPAKDFSARTKLKKSSTSCEPRSHAGLGLDAYIQATSPIRRYMDLCHQRQFISFFRTSKPWVTRPEFELIAKEVEGHLQAATVASRETRRYWLLRYLEQRERGKAIAGTVVRLDLKTPLIELDEIYITLFARVPKGTKLGDHVSLKISAIDPHTEYVRLEAV